MEITYIRNYIFTGNHYEETQSYYKGLYVCVCVWGGGGGGRGELNLLSSVKCYIFYFLNFFSIFCVISSVKVKTFDSSTLCTLYLLKSCFSTVV